MIIRKVRVTMKRAWFAALIASIIAIVAGGAALGATVQYVFTRTELATLQSLADYADTDTSDDFTVLSGYISGKGSVTRQQASAALANLQAYDDDARASAASLRSTISAKLDRTEIMTYIINTNSRVFHEETCHSVPRIKSTHKQVIQATYQELVDKGYKPCGHCIP